MAFDENEFKKIMNVPFAVIIASFIIIIITTNMTDSNGLSALLGGYSGLVIAMTFIMIMNLTFTKIKYLDMFPVGMIIIISGLMLFYLIKYFDRISNDQVSSYYSSFSFLSTIFLLSQSLIIFKALFNKSMIQESSMFHDITFSVLSLFSVINILIVLTLGVILHFYSTEG